MPVEKDAEEYNTAHPNRGYAVILNNDNFLSKNLPFRDGSLQDVANLQNCFDQLGFRVIIHHNLPLQKINLVLDECKYYFYFKVFSWYNLLLFKKIKKKKLYRHIFH